MESLKATPELPDDRPAASGFMMTVHMAAQLIAEVGGGVSEKAVRQRLTSIRRLYGGYPLGPIAAELGLPLDRAYTIIVTRGNAPRGFNPNR